jgi:enamine deaminase RidA (YjgF/YER057c/UK114 family)
VSITRINPDQLHPTAGYHHVTLVGAGPTAYLAGQCPLDGDGAVVGEGDVFAQVDQVVANTLVALRAAKATPSDVVRTVVYVADASDRPMRDVWRRLKDSELGPAFTTASTLLGVSRLAFPGQLLELDVTAAVTGLAT